MVLFASHGHVLGQTSLGLLTVVELSNRTIRASDGLSEEIAKELSKSSNLRIAPMVGISFEHQLKKNIGLSVQFRYVQSGYQLEAGEPFQDPFTRQP